MLRAVDVGIDSGGEGERDRENERECNIKVLRLGDKYSAYSSLVSILIHEKGMACCDIVRHSRLLKSPFITPTMVPNPREFSAMAALGAAGGAAVRFGLAGQSLLPHSQSLLQLLFPQPLLPNQPATVNMPIFFFCLPFFLIEQKQAKLISLQV